MAPTAHSQTVPMASSTPDTADTSPPESRSAGPPPGASAAAADTVSKEVSITESALRVAMRAKLRKVVEAAPAAALIGALVGLVPVVVTMMVYTLNSFGSRIDDTNLKIDDAVAALNLRIDDAAGALSTRIDDTNAHIMRLDETVSRLEDKMEARFAAQDKKIAQISSDITRVLALLLAQNSAGLEPASGRTPAAS